MAAEEPALARPVDPDDIGKVATFDGTDVVWTAPSGGGGGGTPGLVGDIQSIEIGDAATAGSTGRYADAAHQHALPAPAVPAALGGSALAGTATTVARADHVHPYPTAGQVGADPAGAASSAVAAHAAVTTGVHGIADTSTLVTTSTSLGGDLTGTVGNAQIAAGAVGATELASNAVTNDKVADDAIGIAELSATGTPSSSTFLRGDNSWATPSGGGGGAVLASQDTKPATDGSVDLWYETDGPAFYVYDSNATDFVEVGGGGGGGDLLAANNLSDVASAATARVNLGVEIGVDVQAYSSVLAATTASFTTADETKLDGIEALADVTDESNVVAALSGATLSDAGTPASGDKILLLDVSDSDNLKYAAFSEFGGGGGSMTRAEIAAELFGGTPALTFAPLSWVANTAVIANTVYYLRVLQGHTAAATKVRTRVATSTGNVAVAAYGGGSLSVASATRLATSGSVPCPAVGVADVSFTASADVTTGDWLCIGADAAASFGRLGGGADSSTNTWGEGTSYREIVYPPPATVAASPNAFWYAGYILVALA